MNKKISNRITCLLLLAAIFFACNKEKQEKQELIKTENISKDEDMSAYLKQFKEKMLSSSKYDETLSTEDARWHLEAVLNFTHGDAGHETSDIQYDTFQCKLQTVEGMVQLSELNQAFNLISHNVEQVLANCTLPNKSILAIQTKLIDENKNDILTLQSIINTRGSSYPTQYYVDSTDYWYEDDYSGKCGPYQGTCLGTGAVQIIKNKINSNHPNYYCPTGHVYYTDFQDITFSESMVFDVGMLDPNSPHGYRIPVFTCPSSQAPMCLSPDEINYYIVEGLKLINEFAPNNRKVFYSMTNTYCEYVPVGTHLAYHQYTFNYAKPNCGGSLN